MANITRIDVELKTGNRSGAGTDGDIYLGIGGREFYLDSQGDFDDFRPDTDKTYTFGAGANVKFADKNDPRSPAQLLTERLDRFPVYVRFNPENRDDNWNLESITATINPGPNQIRYQALGGSDNLWMGTHSALYCGLLKL